MMKGSKRTNAEIYPAMKGQSDPTSTISIAHSSRRISWTLVVWDEAERVILELTRMFIKDHLAAVKELRVGIEAAEKKGSC